MKCLSEYLVDVGPSAVLYAARTSSSTRHKKPQKKIPPLYSGVPPGTSLAHCTPRPPTRLSTSRADRTGGFGLFRTKAQGLGAGYPGHEVGRLSERHSAVTSSRLSSSLSSSCSCTSIAPGSPHAFEDLVHGTNRHSSRSSKVSISNKVGRHKK